MIIVQGMESTIDPSQFSGLERSIYLLKAQSPVEYRYDSLDELKIEMKLRDRIVNNSRALQNSKADFAAFNQSRSNPKFWTRTQDGGFQLNPGVLSTEAIRDIFRNGRLYAFECATGLVIVLYKSVMDTFGDEFFLRYFGDILLFDWHFDSELKIITLATSEEKFPGDILYFKNPDFNPATPEWQGENVVKLGDNLYYGHGIGIKNAHNMITELNKNRRRNATQSAYLLEQVTYPDFKFFARLSMERTEQVERAERSSGTYDIAQQRSANSVVVKIGSTTVYQT